MNETNRQQAALKDRDAAHSVASDWRPTLQEIVKALTRGDFTLAGGIPGVTSISPSTADDIRRYLEDYGQTLVELPDDTWRTSIAQWNDTYWEVLVDLWTREAGKCDLVLFVFVFEEGDGFRFEIDSVHVP